MIASMLMDKHVSFFFAGEISMFRMEGKMQQDNTRDKGIR